MRIMIPLVGGVIDMHGIVGVDRGALAFGPCKRSESHGYKRDQNLPLFANKSRCQSNGENQCEPHLSCSNNLSRSGASLALKKMVLWNEALQAKPAHRLDENQTFITGD